jgi:hypothetical protein
MTDDADDPLDIVETVPAADDAADGAGAGGDVIHGRPPRSSTRWPMRPSWLAGALVVALLAGIGIGYLIGHSDHGKHVAAATPTPSALSPVVRALPGIALRPGTTCFGLAASNGEPLMVGVELADEDIRPVVLTGLHGVFPLGGLRQIGSQVGQCDNNAIEQVSGHRIEPSATIWLSLILDVQVRCPGPLPVQFRLDYTVGGTPSTQTVNPFPDLDGVPYPGCATPAHR